MTRRSGSMRYLRLRLLAAMGLSASAAPIALAACGARTGLPVPEVEPTEIDAGSDADDVDEIADRRHVSSFTVSRSSTV